MANYVCFIMYTCMHVFTLDLNEKFPLSVLALYKQTEIKTIQLRSHRYFKKAQLISTKREIPFFFNDENRSTNDATAKHAAQTETKTSQILKSHSFKQDIPFF